MPTLTTFIHHCTESPSHSNQTKKIKGIQIRWEKVTPLLFADDKILYTDSPKDITKKKTSFMIRNNKSSKVAGTKLI